MKHRILTTIGLIYIISLFSFGTAYALIPSPASVNQFSDHIEPRFTTDYFKADHIVASSTSATSTNAGNFQTGGTFSIGAQGFFSTYAGQSAAGAYPASNTAPTASFQVPEVDWLTASTSPTSFGWQEGWSTDGPYAYGSSQNFLGQYNKDATWSNVTSNSNPLGEVAGMGFDTHIGGIKTPPQSPFVWASAENYNGCPSGGSNKSIWLFNKNSGLTFAASTTLPAGQDELSGIALDVVNKIMYATTFCTPGKLWIYSVPNMLSSNAATALSGLNVIGSINLSPTIPDAQDVAYANGNLYVSGSTDNAHIEVYEVNPITGQSSILTQNVHSGEPEGIDYDFPTGTIGILTNSTGLVYFLQPNVNSIPVAIFDTLGTTTLKLLHTLSTTTGDYGFNIAQGCYAIGGTCLTTGGGSTNYWTLSGSNLFNNSGTNTGVNTNNPTDNFTSNGTSRVIGSLSSEVGYPGIDDGLIVDVPFSESSGTTAKDRSSNAFVDNLGGAFQSIPNGKMGRGMYFAKGGSTAGYSTFASTTAADGMSSTTISAWVFATTTSFLAGNHTIVSRHVSGSVGEFSCFFADAVTEDCFTQNQAGTRTSTVATVPNIGASGTWHLVTVTYDGVNQIMYYDGLQVASTARSGAMQSCASCVLMISGFSNGPNDTWDGDIDEVKIWNRALSANEVRYLYTQGGDASVIAGNASSTSLTVSNLGGTGTKCLQTDTNGNVTAASAACGTGSGSSGNATWSTTTSTVAGDLINYSNNNTDIVSIGGLATTSDQFFFDPNIKLGYISGQLGIGSLPLSTAPTAILTEVNSTINPIMVLGQSGSGGANFYFWSTQAANTAGAGRLLINSTNATAGSMFALDSNTTNVGIGTTSPFRKLSVQGAEFVAGNATADSFTATNTPGFSGNGNGLTGTASGLNIGGSANSLFTSPDGLTFGESAANDFTSSGNIKPTASGQTLGDATHLWNHYVNGISSGNCADVVTGLLSDAGAPCGVGTVNTGTKGYNAFYNASTNVISATSTIFEDVTSKVGIGSTTPWAKLGIGIIAYDPNSPMWAIGSTTATGTSTPAIVTASGNMAIGTTTGTTQIPNGFSRLSVQCQTGNTDGIAIYGTSGANELALSCSSGNLLANGTITSNSTVAGNLLSGSRLTLSGNGTGSNIVSSIRAGNGQTADIFDTQTVGATNLFSVSAFGLVGISSSTPMAMLGIMSTSSQQTYTFAAGHSTNGISSTTDEVLTNGTGLLGLSTSTPVAKIDSYVSATTTANLLLEAGTTGGCFIIQDSHSGAPTYTSVYSESGTLFSKVATNPNTCN